MENFSTVGHFTPVVSPFRKYFKMRKMIIIYVLFKVRDLGFHILLLRGERWCCIKCNKLPCLLLGQLLVPLQASQDGPRVGMQSLTHSLHSYVPLLVLNCCPSHCREDCVAAV